jgi:hypothetical protein
MPCIGSHGWLKQKQVPDHPFPYFPDSHAVNNEIFSILIPHWYIDTTIMK